MSDIVFRKVPELENSFDLFNSRPKRLQSFHAIDCSLSPDSIQILSAHECENQECENLQEPENLQECENLESLDLSDNPHVGAAENLFSSLPRNLVILILNNCCLTENCMTLLLSNMPQHLEYLYIGGTKLSAGAAEQFRNTLSQHPSLKVSCVDEPVDLSPLYVQKMKKMSTIIWGRRGSDFDMGLAVGMIHDPTGLSVVDYTNSET